MEGQAPQFDFRGTALKLLQSAHPYGPEVGDYESLRFFLTNNLGCVKKSIIRR